MGSLGRPGGVIHHGLASDVFPASSTSPLPSRLQTNAVLPLSRSLPPTPDRFTVGAPCLPASLHERGGDTCRGAPLDSLHFFHSLCISAADTVSGIMVQCGGAVWRVKNRFVVDRRFLKNKRCTGGRESRSYFFSRRKREEGRTWDSWKT